MTLLPAASLSTFCSANSLASASLECNDTLYAGDATSTLLNMMSDYLFHMFDFDTRCHGLQPRGPSSRVRYNTLTEFNDLMTLHECEEHAQSPRDRQPTSEETHGRNSHNTHLIPRYCRLGGGGCRIRG
ncbi:hypothetical protein AcW1_003463 [Taiwanofungus camphoratus]|nr:hypothetical protein AcW1_003463 [Antrodia cinnamomea]